jgi:hypothetical protein
MYFVATNQNPRKKTGRRIENLFNHASQLLMLVTTNASANVNEKR